MTNSDQMIAGAFDSLASDYDALWTYSLVGRLQRLQVLREVKNIFHPGDRVLEIGCGTGVDSAYFASAGIRVHATDLSPKMVDATRARIQRK